MVNEVLYLLPKVLPIIPKNRGKGIKKEGCKEITGFKLKKSLVDGYYVHPINEINHFTSGKYNENSAKQFFTHFNSDLLTKIQIAKNLE